MNNENDPQYITLPLSLLDIQKLPTLAEQEAYLEGFGAACLGAFSVIEALGYQLAQQAQKDGKVPHPFAILTQVLTILKKYVVDNEALRQAADAQGIEGIRSMLKLITTQDASDSNGKKIIQ